MKHYRYLIFKLYSWGKKRSSTPIANVIITLSFVHFIQLFTVYMIVLKLVPEISIFNNDVNKATLYISGVAFLLLNYFIFYNKKRWEGYIKEFGNENQEESKKGKLYVLGYLIGSILLFFLTLIIG